MVVALLMGWTRATTTIGRQPSWQMYKQNAKQSWRIYVSFLLTGKAKQRRTKQEPWKSRSYLPQQLQRLLDAHHQNIKPIQLLQQHYAGGWQTHLDLLSDAPRLEGGRKFFQYSSSHKVDEVIPADTARTLTWVSENLKYKLGLTLPEKIINIEFIAVSSQWSTSLFPFCFYIENLTNFRFYTAFTVSMQLLHMTFIVL